MADRCPKKTVVHSGIPVLGTRPPVDVTGRSRLPLRRPSASALAVTQSTTDQHVPPSDAGALTSSPSPSSASSVASRAPRSADTFIIGSRPSPERGSGRAVSLAGHPPDRPALDSLDRAGSCDREGKYDLQIQLDHTIHLNENVALDQTVDLLQKFDFDQTVALDKTVNLNQTTTFDQTVVLNQTIAVDQTVSFEQTILNDTIDLEVNRTAVNAQTPTRNGRIAAQRSRDLGSFCSGRRHPASASRRLLQPTLAPQLQRRDSPQTDALAPTDQLNSQPHVSPDSVVQPCRQLNLPKPNNRSETHNSSLNPESTAWHDVGVVEGAAPGHVRVRGVAGSPVLAPCTRTPPDIERPLAISCVDLNTPRRTPARATCVDNWSPHFTPGADSHPVQESTPLTKYRQPNNPRGQGLNTDVRSLSKELVSGSSLEQSDSNETVREAPVFQGRSSRSSRRPTNSEELSASQKITYRRWMQLVNADNSLILDESCPEFTFMASLEDSVEQGPFGTKTMEESASKKTVREVPLLQGRSTRSSRCPTNSEERSASQNITCRRWMQLVNTDNSLILDESCPEFASLDDSVQQGPVGTQTRTRSHSAPCEGTAVAPRPSRMVEETLPAAEHMGCRVPIGGRDAGVLRYVGPVHIDDGMWGGEKLETCDRRHDGEVMGQYYFLCALRHGLLEPIGKVRLMTDRSTPASTPVPTSAPVPNHAPVSLQSAATQTMREDEQSAPLGGARGVRRMTYALPQGPVSSNLLPRVDDPDVGTGAAVEDTAEEAVNATMDVSPSAAVTATPTHPSP